MSKRRRLFVIFACLAFAAGLLLFLTPDREPQYQGRPLSAWLGDIEKSQPLFDHEMARLVVRQVGTNALPELQKRIRFRPTGWRTRLIQWKNKLPAKIRNTNAARRLDYDRDFARIKVALFVLGEFGPAAAPAISDLEKLIAEPRFRSYVHGDLVARFSALETLMRIGPAAIPALTDLLAQSYRSPNSSRQAFPNGDFLLLIVPRLGSFGASAEAAIPAILQSMKNKDARFVLESVTALGRIGRQPELVVPVLISALDYPDRDVRASAATALASFGKDALFAVPKLESMNGEFSKVRNAARRTIRIINAAAKGEEPDLGD